MAAPIKYEGGMSLEAIAEAENTTPAAIHMLLTRALNKLRKRGLPVHTCRELLEVLERSRPHAEHTVRSGRRR